MNKTVGPIYEYERIDKDPQVRGFYVPIAIGSMTTDFSVVIASYFAFAGLYDFLLRGNYIDYGTLLRLGIMNGLLFVILANRSQLYNISYLLSPWSTKSKLVGAWLFSILASIALWFLLHAEVHLSRAAVGALAVGVPFLLLATRALQAPFARWAAETSRRAGRRVCVVGEPGELDALAQSDPLGEFGVIEVARVVLPNVGNVNSLSRSERLGLDRAVKAAESLGVEEFVIAVDWRRANIVEDIRARLRQSPLPIRLLPDQATRAMISERRLVLDGPLPSVELQRAPLSGPERLAKRMTDLVVASVALLLLAPVFALLAIAIKVDSLGPVFFRQRRGGFNGRQFLIYKFRTMSVLEDGDSVSQAKQDDPRVTRLGAILRRLSIDELPQLLNVLKGEMSLVGPRPHALIHDDSYQTLIASYARRHHVKPGITGWAQVNGHRGETPRIEDMERRVAHDFWYINNWSLALDLRIAWRTLFTVFDSNAH